MKLPALLLALTCFTVAHADIPQSVTPPAPVHISLRPSALLAPDADGFFALAAIADVSGGDKTRRDKMAVVKIGRAPSPGASRTLTPGDVRLKLRQAGFAPDKDALIDGAKAVEIATPVDLVPVSPSAPVEKPAVAKPTGKPLIKRGDFVTIVIQDGDLTISARGVAREPGGAGDAIRIHRDGVAADLTAVVLDAQTVQLEI